MKSAGFLIVLALFCGSVGTIRAQDHQSRPGVDSASQVNPALPRADSGQKTVGGPKATSAHPASGDRPPHAAATGQDHPGAGQENRQKDTGAAVPPASSGTKHPPAAVQKSTAAVPPATAPPTYPTFIGRPFTHPGAFTGYLLAHNRLFSDSLPPEKQLMTLSTAQARGISNRSLLFYLLLGVFFLLAVIRMGFSKYFQDLFRAFISPTLSQRQLKDQLYQTPFPAFALNVFFTLSAGIYLYLVLLKTGYIPDEDPFFLVALFVVFLMFAYSFKYVVLRICGWLFGYYELMDNYIFTLFLINKIQGVVLLPFILLLAFSTPGWSNAALHISVVLVALLFIYRYMRIFPMIKSQIAFSKFFFLLYICAFEIAPILIIGKLTLLWLKGT